MELALGLDSRDIPEARYADPEEQLERLEAEEKKYEAIINASRVAKYGSLGAVPFFMFSGIESEGSLFNGSTVASFTAATVAAFAEDRAKQKSMALKIKKEEMIRAENPQLYIEEAIENTAEDLKDAKKQEEDLYENPRGAHRAAFTSARERIEFQQEKLNLYSQSYEWAKKNGKVEELSHLICRYESYKAIEPLKTGTFPSLRMPLHGFGYMCGMLMAGAAVGYSSSADKLAGVIILAEMGAIMVKNVARLIKNRKIDKEEEKAYNAVKEFAQKHNKEEKVR